MSSLRLINISKQFGDKLLLDAIDFEFHAGRIYIIRGESGSGKTTLLNIIAGYIEADAGRLEMQPNTKIEYLFQDEMLFSNLTARENMYIKYRARNRDDAGFTPLAESTLAQFNILDLADRKISMLSGGEKQRVQLASILISDPDIILMDEPTSKLDLHNKKTIYEAIMSVFHQKLVIIVSHENNRLIDASINLTLEHGRLHDEKR
ncbi:ABC transporter ATP-binding protein [Paenibacillus dendritiformis]|uniref:ABC transporter n=1 Tax=Paenibacillus dendritiformis C454 TaxID=1131935 RepID=H3SKK7_9BACL|nr:ATP-binding cassette domain-containing protein [Paenibacillus dendritiformis]EHQ60405.1 ABC transporter [Paenibacillus dendritiformis C454]CAH8768126.1 ATP-binding cassette domain-containing protein [Paenibacillus dendritiformis]